MGCGNSNTNSPKITSITANNLHEIGLDLKDSLILFFSKKTLNVNIGIYTDLIYHKKKSSDKIIKYKNKKFFLKNSKKKVINNSIIKKYYEIYPKNIKYSSIGIDDKFSPNFRSICSYNTFFYFDPPYRPLNNTSSFNDYTKEAFNDLAQRRLKGFCDQVEAAGYKFIFNPEKQI